MTSRWLLSTLAVGVVLSAGAVAPSETIAKSPGSSYRIVDLNPTRADARMWPIALNDRGAVVGNMGSAGIFLVSHGHTTVLPPPLVGARYSAALGVDDDGVILAEARTASGPSRFFAVHAANNGWYPLRSGIPGYATISARQIDGRGDIVGTVRARGHGPAGSRDHAVVWMRESDLTYGRAILLPVSNGGSTGRAVWRGGRTLVIAGCSGVMTASENCETVWVRARGGRFHESWGDASGDVEAIDGTRRHLFLGGSGGNGYDESWGFLGTLGIRGGRATVSESNTHRPPNLHSLSWGIAGVTSDHLGRVVAVGGSGNQSSPVRWLTPHHVANLNSLLSSSSHWTLSSAVAINHKGQILGRGTYQGRTHAYLATPVSPSAW